MSTTAERANVETIRRSYDRSEALVNPMAGRVESINLSRGGVPKASVLEALVTEHGIDGDYQDDLRIHGGPDRAVSVFSLERIEALQREGHPIAAGTAGENITISGVDWATVAPGRRLRIGATRLLITKYAAPCENISDSFLEGDFVRISQKVHPGWSRVYARVLAGGVIRPGDSVHVEDPAGSLMNG